MAFNLQTPMAGLSPIMPALSRTSSSKFCEPLTFVPSATGSSASALPYHNQFDVASTAGALQTSSASQAGHPWVAHTNSSQRVIGGGHATGEFQHQHQFELLSEGVEDFPTNPEQLRWKRRFAKERLFRFQETFGWLHTHIGWWKLCILVLGTSLLLVVICWLLFLWHETSQSTNSVWRWLVLYDYLNMSIVVTSSLLRIVVAAQAAVATEMIASIVLEKFGTQFSTSATLSMLRAYGSHPVDLILNWPFKSQAWSMIVCTVVLTFTTLISQLTSVLLVSDLALAVVNGNSQLNETLYGLGWNQIALLAQPDYSQYGPSSFPVFAEFNDSSNIETQPGVDDTGAVMRAILPISSAMTRQGISKYTGFATLLNPRVICIPPKVVSATFSFKYWYLGSGVGIEPYIVGSMSMGDLRPVGLDQNSFWNRPFANFSREFSYHCVLQSAKIPTEWPIGLCPADFAIYHSPPPFLQISSPFNSAYYLPSTYIMVNFSGTVPRAIGGGGVVPNIKAGRAPYITDWVYSHSSPSSPWTNLRSPSNPDFEINLSLCLTSFEAAEANITATSRTGRIEPMLSALKNDTLNVRVDAGNGHGPQNVSYLFDADDVLLQLGADGSLSDYATRGIMVLQEKSKWAELVNSTSINVNPLYQSSDPKTAVLDGSFGFNDMTIQKNISPRSNRTWGLCSYCGMDAQHYQNDPSLSYITKRVDIKLASIFQASLLKSRSPATALQALFTIVSFMQYYDRVEYFQISNVTEIRLFESCLLPVRNRGLTLVIVIVGLHLVFLYIITVLFVHRTKLSILGDTWRSLAQVNNKDMQRLISMSDMSTEKEVELWIHRNGLGDVLVKLEEQDGAIDGRRRAKLERVISKTD